MIPFCAHISVCILLENSNYFLRSSRSLNLILISRDINWSGSFSGELLQPLTSFQSPSRPSTTARDAPASIWREAYNKSEVALLSVKRLSIWLLWCLKLNTQHLKVTPLVWLSTHPFIGHERTVHAKNTYRPLLFTSRIKLPRSNHANYFNLNFINIFWILYKSLHSPCDERLYLLL